MKAKPGFALIELLIAVTILAMTTPGPLPGGRELIRDPHFLLGFQVYSPTPGKHVIQGKLQAPGTVAEPIWGLAQWHSKYSLAGVQGKQLPLGEISFADEAKQVILAPPGTPDSDLVLAVNSKAEYGDRARRQGEPWVHLLANQPLQDSPSLAELRKLTFTISARLRKAQMHKTPDYTPRLHTAQFTVFITVQNRNRHSAGYGDFLWFGIPLYDARYPLPRTFKAPDQALKKLIYTPPGQVYTTQSLHSGKWVTVQKDLLPLMRQALETAWKAGVLEDSHNLANYRLGGINLGWEVPGIFEVEMQVRNLSLKALMAEPEN